MQESDFRLPASYPGGDSTAIFVRSFQPDAGQKPRAIVQLIHGMAEHGARYARLGAALTARGYGAYIADQRGHGYTVTRQEDLGYFADEDGWNKVVSDQLGLRTEIESRHPGVPVFLLGHSMGSFVARSVALRIAGALPGLLLSGTGHDAPMVPGAGRLLAKAEVLRIGKRARSAMLRNLTFDSFNKTVENPRTACDWLSRDPAEVDKYIADPLCGFDSCAQLYVDMLGGMADVYKQESLERMPKQLPIYIFSGERDPVGGLLKGIKKLHKALERAQFKDVTLRVYQGARHELFNETNRDEVTADMIAWLDQKLPS